MGGGGESLLPKLGTSRAVSTTLVTSEDQSFIPLVLGIPLALSIEEDQLLRGHHLVTAW